MLSTSNSTELYLSIKQRVDLQEALVRWLCDYYQFEADEVRQSLYWCLGDEAVSYLMRIGGGLDSLVVCKSQVLGQVKRSMNPAVGTACQWI